VRWRRTSILVWRVTPMNDPGASYRSDRLSPSTRFDEVETTVSHLFRRPHPALQGRTFGRALHDALSARKLLDAHQVVELGGGAGFVAAELSAAHPGLSHGFVELSRPLLRAQRGQVPAAWAVAGHAEALPFSTRSLRGLFLANEVIADLRVCRADSEEGIKLSARYDLGTSGTLLNAGALNLISELSRTLAPGAAALLTEFGGDFAPSPVRLEGPFGAGKHTEHSIHFGHLEGAARAHGLQTERHLLADLLGFDRSVEVASYPDVLRLRRFVPSLPVLAHPRAELEARHPLLTRFFRFDFPTVGSPRFPEPQARGGFCQLFCALLLRQPR
jgi:hypothetical protein